MVYSDCLQEIGDPRGELITLQHALASDPENTEIQARVDELLKKHRTTWLKRFVWFDKTNLEMTWRLGFLHTVDLDRTGKDDAASCVTEFFRLPAARLLHSLTMDVDRPQRIWTTLLETQPRLITLRYLCVSERGRRISTHAAFPRLHFGEVYQPPSRAGKNGIADPEARWNEIRTQIAKHKRLRVDAKLPTLQLKTDLDIEYSVKEVVIALRAELDGKDNTGMLALARPMFTEESLDQLCRALLKGWQHAAGYRQSWVPLCSSTPRSGLWRVVVCCTLGAHM